MVENLLSNSYIYIYTVYIIISIYIARSQDFHDGIVSNIFQLGKTQSI